jgi:hypothetical protein
MSTDLRAPQPREHLVRLAETKGRSAGQTAPVSSAASPAVEGAEIEPVHHFRPIDKDIDHGAETEQPHTANSELA